VPRIDVGPTDMRLVLDLLRKHVPKRRVVVFGSRVTGRAKPFSDLDLAILGEGPIESHVLSALAEDFDESSLPFRVDIVDWSTTAPSFREIISRDAVTLQDAETTE
jgi:predicted nucleotidyltransferase